MLVAAFGLLNNNMSPVISVIIPVYNGAQYVTEAISSVLAQTFNDWELIIIDDGSTDETLTLLNQFQDARIKIISREHRGLIASLNEGLALAQGEFIARLDADDICLPYRFEKQLVVFANPEIALVGSWAYKIDADGQEFGVMSYPPADYHSIKKYFLKHNPFIQSSVMMRRSALQVVGGYSPRFKVAEDYELWSRLLAKFPAVNLTEPLIKYRLNPVGETSKHNFLMRRLGLKIRLLGLIRLFL